MYCKNCGKKLPDYANFCSECGMRVTGTNTTKTTATVHPRTSVRSEGPKVSDKVDKQEHSRFVKNTQLRKRLLPVVFVFISLLLLMTDWLTVKLSIQYNMSQFRSSAILVLNEAEMLIEDIGIDVDIRPVYEIVSIISDGTITPIESFLIAKDAIPVLSEIKPYTGLMGRDAIMFVNTLFVMGYLYVGILLASVVSGGATLIARIRGTNSKVNRLFFVSQFLLLSYFGFICYLANSDDEYLPIRLTVTAVASVIFACLSGPRKDNRKTEMDAESEDSSPESTIENPNVTE